MDCSRKLSKYLAIILSFYMPIPPVDLIDGHNDLSVYYLKQPALVDQDQNLHLLESQILFYMKRWYARGFAIPWKCLQMLWLHTLEDGRIAALCFERHSQDLGTVARNDIYGIDIEKVITCGAKNLHSFGVVHVSRLLSSDLSQRYLYVERYKCTQYYPCRGWLGRDH